MPHLKPFSWYGGKEALAPLLVSLLPVHDVYCEVFGGSAALLFAKPKSRLEIFNDLDSGVVNFFRVLRHPEQSRQLQHLLSAYEEYHDCLEQWDTTDDPVERARQWSVGVMQSMNSSIRATGWSATRFPGSNPARAFHHTVAERLARCTERLAEVQIDHRDFERVLAIYDGLGTCFYLDPPYLPSTRRKRSCYHQEMSTADHERLLVALGRLQGMVILSGYAHPLYTQALSSWQCVHLTTNCPPAVRARSRSDANEVHKEWTRTECLWLQVSLRAGHTHAVRAWIGKAR